MSIRNAILPSGITSTKLSPHFTVEKSSPDITSAKLSSVSSCLEGLTIGSFNEDRVEIVLINQQPNIDCAQLVINWIKNNHFLFVKTLRIAGSAECSNNDILERNENIVQVS